MSLNRNGTGKQATAVLEIEHLCKSYPGFALKDVNLALKPGTITGLLGRNGAGKTTLIKCALGLIPCDRGSIKFHGAELKYGSAAWRQSVGYVAESHPLYDWMRVERFLKFIAVYYPTWDGAYCQQLLDRFSIDPHKRIRDLSHGMRVKLALVSALAYRPTLLVLDEPTSGLDPVIRAEFLNELRDEIVHSPKERAVLISSHVLEDITAVADEIVIIRNGELVIHAPLFDLAKVWRILAFNPPPGLDVPPLVNHYRTIRGRDGLVLLLCRADESDRAAAELAAAGIEPIEVRMPTLQEVFLALA